MRKGVFWVFVLCLFGLQSCLIPRKVVYVNDLLPDTLYRVMEERPITVQRNDRLTIIVAAKNPELAAPFNLGVAGYRVTEDGRVATTSTEVGTEKGYIVDVNGNIEFPILGVLRVEGLTVKEIGELIKGKLISSNLLNDPMVAVELVNLKVIMLGEVNSIGVLNVAEGRITLLEAIARSGGLSANATPDQVTVIREENGERRMYVNNIESKEIFNSPAYHLKQNDIVYVVPHSAVNTPRVDRNWLYFSTILGLATTVLTLFIWTRR